MKTKLFSIVFAANLFLLLAVMPQPASAQYGCNGQYGQYGDCPQSQSILVDKLVAMPAVTKGGVVTCDSSLTYQDNYSPSDARFTPNGYVCFAIKVKNTSNVTLSNVTLKDYFPSYVNAVEGPGSYDVNSRTFTYYIGDIPSGTQNIYYVKAQIYAQNLLPSDKGLMCLVNRAQAYNGTVSDDDTAQFCIEKQVTPGPKTPSSGPEMGVFLLGGEAALLAAGIYLRRKTS